MCTSQGMYTNHHAQAQTTTGQKPERPIRSRQLAEVNAMVMSKQPMFWAMSMEKPNHKQLNTFQN